MIYDRPVTALMRDAAEELPAPTTVAQIVEWFGQRYPKVKPSTVRAHIKGLTSNDPSRQYYPTAASKPALFFRIPNGYLDRYDPDRHMGEETPESDGADEATTAVDEISDDVMEFAIERQLEEFLLDNWHAIDWGRPLELWSGSDGTSGHQLDTGIAGRLDFLCVDNKRKRSSSLNSSEDAVPIASSAR